MLPFVSLECFWIGLIVKAVDDNKNNLTYFVRVDWHLPERELTKTSEANLFLEHLKTCLLPCCEFLSICLREMMFVSCLLFWHVLDWFDCEGR